MWRIRRPWPPLAAFSASNSLGEFVGLRPCERLPVLADFIHEPATRNTSLACVTDRPPPDPEKLLADWMEWERGETMPGRVMSNLKTHGLRELLDELAAKAAASSSDG